MSVRNTRWHRQLLVPALALGLLSACSDDNDDDKDNDEQHEDGGGKDAGDSEQDGGETGLDGGTPDASEPDAAVPAKKLTEIFAAKTPLAADQADRFWTATFDADGKILAGGFVTDVVAGSDPVVLDRKFAVARFTVDGALDKTFGDVDPVDATKRLGIARVNVFAATTFSDDEAVRGIAVQQDGKIVIAGTVETAKAPGSLTHMDGAVVDGTISEIDTAVARLTAEGALDSTFSASDADGKPGIWQANLSTVAVTISVHPTTMAKSLSTGNEDVGDLKVDSEDRIVLFARAKNPAAERTDLDRYILRFLKDGAVDGDFGEAGRVVWSSPGSFSENTRTGTILADDSIISSGYTNISGKNTVILLKLDNKGVLVPTFGTDGAQVYNPFANAVPASSGYCEAYAAALQSTGHFVTTGYGKEDPSLPSNSMISLRFDANGAPDTSYGETSGFTNFTKTKAAVDDNVGVEQGRNALALPDDRVLMVGNASTVAGAADGVAVLLSKDGKFDTSFDDGPSKTYDFGLKGDQLWGLSLSRDNKYVAVAGFSGAATGEARALEDAALVIYELKD